MFAAVCDVAMLDKAVEVGAQRRDRRLKPL